MRSKLLLIESLLQKPNGLLARVAKAGGVDYSLSVALTNTRKPWTGGSSFVSKVKAQLKIRGILELPLGQGRALMARRRCLVEKLDIREQVWSDITGWAFHRRSAVEGRGPSQPPCHVQSATDDHRRALLSSPRDCRQFDTSLSSGTKLANCVTPL
jgi:hypothetical protein